MSDSPPPSCEPSPDYGDVEDLYQEHDAPDEGTQELGLDDALPPPQELALVPAPRPTATRSLMRQTTATLAARAAQANPVVRSTRAP